MSSWYEVYDSIGWFFKYILMLKWIETFTLKCIDVYVNVDSNVDY